MVNKFLFGGKCFDILLILIRQRNLVQLKISVFNNVNGV